MDPTTWWWNCGLTGIGGDGRGGQELKSPIALRAFAGFALLGLEPLGFGVADGCIELSWLIATS